MNLTTIENTSNLLNALRRCGAIYSDGEITMPNFHKIKVVELKTVWKLVSGQHYKVVKKNLNPEEMKNQILELHIVVSRHKLSKTNGTPSTTL